MPVVSKVKLIDEMNDFPHVFTEKSEDKIRNVTPRLNNLIGLYSTGSIELFT